uniref:C1q domain-containing protein n=1 Tax=Maylandia zebra TaxID=106582 RepID=A0A3P9B100_9CICH
VASSVFPPSVFPRPVFCIPSHSLTIVLSQFRFLLSYCSCAVAFSAFLMNQGTGYTGPFPTLFTLIFKRAVTNIGNAYNPSTGIFTAPVRGENIQAGALLYRNGEKISIAYELPTSGGVSASNAASLLLQAGDQVSVRLSAYSRIYENPDNHNTFSGHLLFTM